MKEPELIFVVGCNAAGKSTFIRTRLNELENFKVLMTDVYKGRTKELAKKAISQGQDVLIETVFNDTSFKDLVDEARHLNYNTSLVVLFLDSVTQSFNRVTNRVILQSGITISGDNVKINFNESFKNVANYFFYFDKSDFIYTGENGINQLIMSFQKSNLLVYNSNELAYPQKFAAYGFKHQRLAHDIYSTIVLNKDFKGGSISNDSSENRFKM